MPFSRLAMSDPALQAILPHPPLLVPTPTHSCALPRPPYQIQLHPHLVRCSARLSSVEVLRETALAFLVEGYTQGFPHLIHKAEQLLQQAKLVQQREPQGQGAEGEEWGSVVLERAVCTVLLGQPGEALRLLGLAEGGEEGEPEVAQFIRVRKKHVDEGAI